MFYAIYIRNKNYCVGPITNIRNSINEIFLFNMFCFISYNVKRTAEIKYAAEIIFIFAK